MTNTQLLEQNGDAIKCRHGVTYVLTEEQACRSRSVQLRDEVGILKVNFRLFQVYAGADSLRKIYIGKWGK